MMMRDFVFRVSIEGTVTEDTVRAYSIATAWRIAEERHGIGFVLGVI
jgi:hypothetical protein